ncbi:MAG: RnfABCDGE type electron transport complex subunit G [Massilibacteroides sp.]|nr:RnfABCDGE type electron transport complex subunit G [Massilibacteroides sp.]MDD3061725.1 RnfABCDGE type electron transport complex subunit G [Massilibacteroides sp.]MDD4115155.1 RnfABCDGE type electron transport complex subunit G [Massilibacteroides sp.]MDD4660608.1 RnfABCDGE type electron transport complex subunit G [Massilibacteroides sp.]
MAKLKSTLPNMFLSLTLICIITSGLLAATYKYTSGPIAETEALALKKAVQEVSPEFDNDPIKDSFKVETPDGYELLIYPAVKDGQNVGAAVESSTKHGFNGLIRLIVGFDAEGKIRNYSILQHSETPGLGAKMGQWFKTDKNKQSIIGRSLANGNLSVSKDGGDVDAITASTITSRAFLEAINRAYNAYAGIDASTGATPQKDKEESSEQPENKSKD